jgi:hypothetical protein
MEPSQNPRIQEPHKVFKMAVQKAREAGASMYNTTCPSTIGNGFSVLMLDNHATFDVVWHHALTVVATFFRPHPVPMSAQSSYMRCPTRLYSSAHTIRHVSYAACRALNVSSTTTSSSAPPHIWHRRAEEGPSPRTPGPGVVD